MFQWPDNVSAKKTTAVGDWKKSLCCTQLLLSCRSSSSSCRRRVWRVCCAARRRFDPRCSGAFRAVDNPRPGRPITKKTLSRPGPTAQSRTHPLNLEPKHFKNSSSFSFPPPVSGFVREKPCQWIPRHVQPSFLSSLKEYYRISSSFCVDRLDIHIWNKNILCW